VCKTISRARTKVCSDKCAQEKRLRRWRLKGETCKPAGPVKYIKGDRVDTYLNNRRFYSSQEWMSVRYVALREHGFKCLCCGRSAKNGVELHVDHIKPISKYPELRLEIENLQVLCRDCNLGKSNKFEDDFRKL